MFTIINLLIKIYSYYILLLVFANLYWVANLVYSKFSLRSKIIKVKNIILLPTCKYLIDSNDESYIVFKDSFLTNFNILDYINEIEINKEYEIKFYGFNTYFTTKKIIYAKPNE